MFGLISLLWMGVPALFPKYCLITDSILWNVTLMKWTTKKSPCLTVWQLVRGNTSRNCIFWNMKIWTTMAQYPLTWFVCTWSWSPVSTSSFRERHYVKNTMLTWCVFLNVCVANSTTNHKAQQSKLGNVPPKKTLYKMHRGWSTSWLHEVIFTS